MSVGAWSPVDEVLVAVALGRPLPAPWPLGLDWSALLVAAERHRLLPLLGAALRDAGGTGPDVPTPVVEALRAARRSTLARGLALGQALDEVVAHLGSAGIPVALLKGAALSGWAYPDPALRPMSDLDLLVPEADLRRAHAGLEAAGWRVAGTELGRDDDQRLATVHHHFPLLSPSGAVMVELHHRLIFDRPGYGGGELLARARPVGDPPRLLPVPEDLFLHVAVHFATDRIRHVPCALGQVADLVRVAAAGPLDWSEVVARARAAAVEDRLFLALDVLDRLGRPGPAPADVLVDLRPAGFDDAVGERFLRRRVLAGDHSLNLEAFGEGGARRLFPPRDQLLRYVRPGDARAPSTARLHARRVGVLASRAGRQLGSAGALVDDVRLARWLVRQRR